MSKKDRNRNYTIWGLMILFYIVFYFVNHWGWMDAEPIIKSGSIAIDPTSSSHTTSTGQEPHNETSDDQNTFSSKSTSTKKASDPSTTKDHIPEFASSQNFNGSSALQNSTLDINQASVQEWQQLYNIGPYRAEKIVNFREALGGFYEIRQVGETYALPDSVFIQIEPYLKITSPWSMLPINILAYDSLYLHPYITRQMAYFIVRHRENQGPYADMDDLYKILEEKYHERLKMLEPYLDFGIK